MQQQIIKGEKNYSKNREKQKHNSRMKDVSHLSFPKANQSLKAKTKE